MPTQLPRPLHWGIATPRTYHDSYLDTTAPPTSWAANLNGQPVCILKGKDIGGWTATWMGDRLWQPPAHMPKATPQPMSFFSSLEDAKAAVEQALAT